MGVKYYYNFILTAADSVDLSGDIFSAVRRSYFVDFNKIKDRITINSEDDSLDYEYEIEHDKPMRWLVKAENGEIYQDVQILGNGRYNICFYRDEVIYKRMLLSRLHTLLKVEYLSPNGAVCASLEPRRVQGGLCLLYTDLRLNEPLVLSAAPDIFDDEVRQRVYESFADYTAVASTNEDIVLYLSDTQTASFKELVKQVEKELENEAEQSFMEEAPLYDKIKAKDFNVKRNLSAMLDISKAQPFGTESAKAEQPISVSDTQAEKTPETTAQTEPNNTNVTAVENTAETESSIQNVQPEPENTVPAEQVDTKPAEAETDATVATAAADASNGEEDGTENDSQPEKDENAPKPDKLIQADGAVYSYYGELDSAGNRSGYGRTLTDLGRTAYEGMYRNDKRQGKGAYFYKDGTLCYSGDWSENVRHGVGVGISSRDGSIHAGCFVNNKPEGNGVRLSADGDIRFVCKKLSDGSSVLMTYLPDDTVHITKYDKNGAKQSEKTVSLTEF